MWPPQCAYRTAEPPLADSASTDQPVALKGRNSLSGSLRHFEPEQRSGNGTRSKLRGITLSKRRDGLALDDQAVRLIDASARSTRHLGRTQCRASMPTWPPQG
jgi:hypothetical protein